MYMYASHCIRSQHFEFFLQLVWFCPFVKYLHLIWNCLDHPKGINLILLCWEFPPSLKALHVCWRVSLICICIWLHLVLTSGDYAAAYDANIEWVIVKGVASYFHQSQSATDEWMSFASAMAASVVARILNDPVVFREWPHCNQGKSHHWKNNLNGETEEEWLFLARFYIMPQTSEPVCRVIS